MLKNENRARRNVHVNYSLREEHSNLKQELKLLTYLQSIHHFAYWSLNTIKLFVLLNLV